MTDNLTYATSGSVGDVCPDFLIQMKNAMNWQGIPESTRRQLFWDAPPNPVLPGGPQRLQPYSHAKVIFQQRGRKGRNGGMIYVGSHNFSQAAWGLRNKMPVNVEAGVVLSTKSFLQQDEWCERLPCLLPDPGELSPRSSYEPASASTDFKQAYK